jgi:ABC-type transport system involved in multi-copper enzyme maturation permease subunit
MAGFSAPATAHEGGKEGLLPSRRLCYDYDLAPCENRPWQGDPALLVGPVFSREVVIAPRRTKIYVARTTYVAALLLLMVTAWLVLAGAQRVRDLGDLARFGTILFQILAPLQLALAVFFSAMLAAGAVAEEKDRRTLVLLLLTRLSNSELVLGKLLASLLGVLVMLLGALPLFMLSALLGGVSFDQIARVFAVTLASVLACGSLGSTLALWREKTFQALAMTALVLGLWLAFWRMVAMSDLGSGWQAWAAALSPLEAIFEAARPQFRHALFHPLLGGALGPVGVFLVAAAVVSLLLNGVGVAMVRVWNPSRESQPASPDQDAPRGTPIPAAEQGAPQAAAEASGDSTTPAAPARHGMTRRVWDNPVLWREIRTWAYGRKILLIKLAYLTLFSLAVLGLYGMGESAELGLLSSPAAILVLLFLLSLVLVNAQAVTSMTSERDAKALDLLLVTDLTSKEIIFGKLGGVFHNAKEMVVLPMLLCVCLSARGTVSLENMIYLLGGLGVLYVFVATVGIHAGMIYANSQAAIATSLGTVFFLFVGVATCMWILVALGGSFEVQLIPFFVLIVVGGVGLYVALGIRNPSPAIGLASVLCPLATFYAITSFLLDYTLGVFLVTALAYGFATAAMLVPAIYEFDVATGRTTAE